MANVTPERAEAICKMLLDGDTTTTLSNCYGKSASWVWAVAQQNGLVYDQSSKRWNRKDESQMHDRTVIEGVVQSLLDGDGRDKTGQNFGLTGEQVRTIARREGLVYVGPKMGGKWTRQEQEHETMTTEAWNMSTEDYEALLKPERERSNGNGQAEAVARRAVRPAGTEHFDSYDTDTAAALAESPPEDSDIMTAVKLLDMAEAQRSKDIAEIERLNTVINELRDFNGRQAEDRTKEMQAAESRITRLETEIRRLDDALKVEISKNVRAEERGLLRQSIDRLSKVL